MKQEDKIAVTIMLIIVVVMFILGARPVHGQEVKTFKVEGTTYSSTGGVKSHSKSEPIVTNCTWVDSKGVTYPIFMSQTGSCYIIKTSAKTGKEYKSYLKPDVSQDICRKLGKEYKGKTKK